MDQKIRIGIVGHGNLGRGVERAIAKTSDMELVGIFSRRPAASVQPLTADVPVLAYSELEAGRDDIDVLILCGGSKSDLPVQSPQLAERYSIVDSFDNHGEIPTHFATVHKAARAGGTVAVISTGWDPGLFSINRLFGEAILPQGQTYTFWGRGLSQGHSDAVRRITGVAQAVQYTLPNEEAIAAVRSGSQPEFTTRQKHTRQVFVVLAAGADAGEVQQAIVTMPGYFEPYDTTVTFIDAEEMARDHSGMPHGGFVIRSGTTAERTAQVIEYRLDLESNPEFTASVLVAYARAAARLHRSGQVGCHTVFDIAPGLLSPKSAADLRQELL